jgi:hypothetical protein
MSFSPFTCYAKVALPQQLPKWENYWLQIRGCWLEIYKKVSMAAHFSILLDLASLTSGHEATNLQNSLFIESSVPTGSLKLYISSTSRCEIIHLFNALTKGWTHWKDISQGDKFKGDFECNSNPPSGFMKLSKKSQKFALTRDAFIVDQKEYPITTIVSMSPKQNDPNSASKLIVTVQAEGGIQQREFAGLISSDTQKICTGFLIRLRDLAGKSPTT